MGKLYWVFIVGFCALLGYAGATGNFGIIPKLPFLGGAQPATNTMTAPIIHPDMTGSAYFNADQMVAIMRKNGGSAEWERAKDDQSWIMRYSMRNELTGKPFDGAIRFSYLADASRAGVEGPGLLVTGWAEDGRQLNGVQISYSLYQVATNISRDGQP